MTIRALLVDDDHKLYELLAAYFSPQDVHLNYAADGPKGLAAIEAGGVDLVLLDVMMPGMDGLTVLKRLRERSAVPVLMLTARGDETDRVVGLELGADDYLGKPFYPRELLARMRAVLRRTTPGPLSERLVVGDLEIDGPARTAHVGGQSVALTALQFDLLQALAERAGRVVSREALWEAAGRGDTTVGERTIDVHISNLRNKLGDDAKDPKRLKTVRGAGYVLVKEPG